jgi:maltose phosphorylase
MEIDKEINGNEGFLITSTLKTDYHVATGMNFEFIKDNRNIPIKTDILEREKYIAGKVTVEIRKGEELILYKYVSVLSSLNNKKEKLAIDIKTRLKLAKEIGYQKLFLDHINEWAKIWSTSDVVIDGDISAQQEILFNIFHINQTYTGKDERLNIGPKGFTGEKYGGSTYWDTEAFALPFFLKTADQKVGKNL